MPYIWTDVRLLSLIELDLYERNKIAVKYGQINCSIRII